MHFSLIGWPQCSMSIVSLPLMVHGDNHPAILRIRSPQNVTKPMKLFIGPDSKDKYIGQKTSTNFIASNELLYQLA